MKKRLIPLKYIEKAYTRDDTIQDMDLTRENTKERLDKLPGEIFEILGDVISFIENTNKLEGENYENK